MKQNMRTILLCIAGLCGLISVLQPSVAEGQTRRILGVRNIRVEDNRSVFNFGDTVTLFFQVYNADRERIDLRGQDIIQFQVVARILQDSIQRGQDLPLDIETFANTSFLPGERIGPDRRTIRVLLKSSELNPGGTVVVIWPRGAMIVPFDTAASRISFEVFPTGRGPLAANKVASFYPNPSSDLPVFSDWLDIRAVKLYDASGRLALTGLYDEDLRNHSASLLPGIYAIIAEDGAGRQWHFKWIKP